MTSLKSRSLAAVAILCFLILPHANATGTGNGIGKAECDLNLLKFPNLQIGSLPSEDPTAQATHKRIDAENSSARERFYAGFEQEVSGKTWYSAVEFFGTTSPQESQLENLIGQGVAGYEALQVAKQTDGVNQWGWLEKLAHDRNAPPADWRLPRVYFFGRVLSVAATPKRDSALLAVELPDGSVREVIAEFDTTSPSPYRGLRILSDTQSIDEILIRAMNQYGLLREIGPDRLAIAATITELFGTLPSGHATTGIIKILRGKSKQYTKHPFFGRLAGDRSVNDVTLRNLGYTVERFLKYVGIRQEVSTDRSDYWIPSTQTANEKALKVAKLINPEHQFAAESPASTVTPVARKVRAKTSAKTAEAKKTENLVESSNGPNNAQTDQEKLIATLKSALGDMIPNFDELLNQALAKNERTEKNRKKADSKIVRVFAPITAEELEAKIVAAVNASAENRSSYEQKTIKSLKEGDDHGYPLHEITDQVEADLRNYSFGTENMSYGPNGAFAKGTIGMHTLPNGMTYQAVSVGRDSDWPMLYIVYWDGEDLRGYVPEDGNPFNTTTLAPYSEHHEADDFGTNQETDIANVKRRFPEAAAKLSKGQSEYLLFELAPFDQEKIQADIMKTIQPKK